MLIYHARVLGERQQPENFEQLNAITLKSQGITNPERPIHHHKHLIQENWKPFVNQKLQLKEHLTKTCTISQDIQHQVREHVC